MASPFSCEQCEELLAGYLLGALDLEEARTVAAHLATCDRCQMSQEAYQAVLDQLAQAVPLHDPPGEVQQGLLAAIQEETALTSPGLTRRQPRRTARQPRWVWLLTAANILLCLGMAWWTWQASREVAMARQKVQGLQYRLALQHQALTLIATPRMRAVALGSGAAGSQARGVLWLQPDETQAVLVVQDLPPLQPHRAYQLWLRIGDGQRDNGGVFRVDERGFGIWPITAPRPLATYQAVGITEEPAGGSPGPTSPRVIGGTL